MDFIIEPSWPMFSGFLLALIWLIRLEAKVLYLEKDSIEIKASNRILEDKISVKLDNLTVQINELNNKSTRIETKLEFMEK